MPRNLNCCAPRASVFTCPSSPVRYNPPVPRPRLLLSLILLVYLAIGGLYAALTPPWQVPDEPAHYNYIRHLVEQRSLPILQPGDYDALYLERLKAERFPPNLPTDSVRYEAWQPPLYYLLAAPVFAATNGSLIAIRLFTLSLGALVILLTYALGRALFPASPGLALLAAGFIAFVPQHVAMMAAANNDALAEAILALGLLLALRVNLPTPSHPHTPAFTRAWIMLGVVLGLAFLSKLSAYPLAALMAVALVLAARREGWTRQQLALHAAQVFGPALLLGGAWWGRNLAVYGGLDFLAFARHDLVVQGQLRTSEALALWGARAYAVNFIQTTFQSFWGQFGWMGVVMDQRVYLALLAYSIVIIVGCVGAFAGYWRAKAAKHLPSPSRRPWPPERSGVGEPVEEGLSQRDALVLLVGQALLTLAVFLYYNLTFVQFQGRYLYPALPVVALAAAVALRQWAHWLAALLPARFHPLAETLLPLIPLALQAALALYALYAYILPQLAPPPA